MERCHRAIMRDFEQRYGNRADGEYHEWGYELLSVLFLLATGDRSWQTVSIARPDTRTKPDLVIALIETWGLLLEPWLADRERIRWHAIIDLLVAIHPLPQIDRDALKEHTYDAYPESAKRRAEIEAFKAKAARRRKEGRS